MARYMAARLDGSTTVHTSRAALESARRRARGGRTIVESWPETDPPPAMSASAREWNDYRMRRGHPGR